MIAHRAQSTGMTSPDGPALDNPSLVSLMTLNAGGARGPATSSV